MQETFVGVVFLTKLLLVYFQDSRHNEEEPQRKRMRRDRDYYDEDY